MNKIIPATVLAIVFLVTACAHKEIATVVTKDVNIAVPVPCTVDIKNQRPDLMTRERLWEQLSLVPNSDARAKIVTSQLLGYMGWLPVVEGAMQGCEMAPKHKNP